MYTTEQVAEGDVLELSIGGAVRAMQVEGIDNDAQLVDGVEVDLSSHEPQRRPAAIGTGTIPLRVWARAEQITAIIRDGVSQ